MNRNKIFFISILMGVALIGLIGLQINWIKHDFMLRQDKFYRQAKLSLDRAIRKMETKATVHLITNEMNDIFDDSVTAYFRSAGLPDMPDIEVIDSDEFIGKNTNHIQVKDINDSTEFSRIEILGGKEGESDKLVIEIQQDLNERNEDLVIVKKELKEAGREIQYHKAVLEKIEDEHKRRMNHERKARKINKVYDKMVFEYSFRDSVLLEQVMPGTLDSLIEIELKDSGIDLPYSVRYTSTGQDTLKLADKRNSIVADTGLVVSSLIFPEGIINRDDTVSLIFPNTLGYFLSSMWFMLLSSVLFTAIIIFAFSYTVMIIFRQKKLSEMKNDFINNMTHEFKTPIATIRLASNALGKDEVQKSKEKMNFYSNIIRIENDRMNDQVENILQIAQFDKSAFVSDLNPVDLTEVINNAVVMMQLHAEQKGGFIEVINQSHNSVVMADKRFIPLVFVNLLDNAIKYCDKKPSVKIQLSNQEKFLVITIKDNGIGMDKDKMQKVFDKFYRVPSGNIHNVKGFGLGLSYVKAIVTAHDGTIEVRSKPGEGSEFIINLPNIDQNI